MATIPNQTMIDWTARFRVALTKFIEAIEEMTALLVQWGHMDYDTTYDISALAGTSHEGLTKLQIKAALDAIVALNVWLGGADNWGKKLWRLIWRIR